MNVTLPLLLIQATTTTAPAGGDAQNQGGVMGFLTGMTPILLCFAVFWFIIIRPEQKQRKKRAQMLAEMKKGDKVLTTGGMYGQIVQIQDDVVTLQVAEGTRLRFTRSAIQSVENEVTEAVGEAKTNGA